MKSWEFTLSQLKLYVSVYVDTFGYLISEIIGTYFSVYCSRHKIEQQ